MRIKRLIFGLILVFINEVHSQDRIFNIEETIPVTFFKVKAEVGIWYKSANCANSNHSGRLTKPFIICEGFDIAGGNDLPTLYASMGGSSFLGQLRADGWDVVIVNLLNNGDAIENNALLIERLLVQLDSEIWINHTDYGTNYHRPTLMGISMGGLICRLALARMEIQQIDHKVERLLTFDAPNKGANIPLGLQAFINKYTAGTPFANQFRSSMPNFMRNLDPISWIDQYLTKGYLTQTAAYQMAATLYGPVNLPRSNFLSYMNALGKYPQKCRLVGIANGTNGISQNNLWAGKTIFSWEGALCPINTSVHIPVVNWDVGLKFCPFTIEEKFWAMPGNGVGVIENTIWGTQLQINSAKFSTQAPMPAILANPGGIDATNIDYAPGGKNRLSTFGINSFADWVNSRSVDIHECKRIIVKECIVPAWTSVCTCRNSGCNRFWCWDFCCWWASQQSGCNYWFEFDHNFCFDFTWNQPLGTVNYTDEYAFVPTVSALDINRQSWFTNVAEKGNYPHDKSFTPFDAIYWHNSNSDHAIIDFGNNNAQPKFMMEEISPDNLFIQNRTFPDGYKNTFEARGYVAIGKNVDLVSNRTPQGDVLLASTSDVTFSVGTGGGNFVYFDDGFDSNGATVDVKYNSYMDNGSTCSKLFSTVSTTLTRNQTWNQLRTADDSEVEAEEKVNKLVVSEDTNPQKFDVSAWLQEGNTSQSTFKVEARPNPFNSETVLGFNLSETSVVSLQIFNSRGALVSNVLKEALLAAGNNTAIVNLENQLPGLYIYRLVVNGQNFSGKLIKQ